jgi:hypothetical protein
MSLENVNKILDLALIDLAYRELLYNQPEQALIGHVLEEHERMMLSRLGSAPYTLSLQGLSDARRMVEAARLYKPLEKVSA